MADRPVNDDHDIASPTPDEVAVKKIRRELMADRRQVAIFWNIDDMRSVRPDLDDDQAWRLLLKLEDDHDGYRGITWETIDAAAQELFPLPHVSCPDARTEQEAAATERRLPSPSEIIANPKAYLPEHGGDRDFGQVPGSENGR